MKSLNRRKAMGLLSSSMATLPFSVLGDDADPNNRLHEYCAAKAQRLANNMNVQINILLPEGSSANVVPVSAAFSQMTGINVVSIEAPLDGINTQLTLDALSGLGEYDVALPATFGLPELVSAGAIIPIDHFAETHEPSGFREGILYQTGDSFDDQLYGFQTDGDAYVMFYHREFLESKDEQDRFADKHGYQLALPRTWAELDKQIEFFNRPDDGIGGGLLFRTPNYLAWEWWVRFHAKGIWPFSKTLTPQIAGEEGVLALEELIRVTEHLCPEVSKLGLFGNWERYSKGDVYCNIGWGGSQKYLNSSQSAMRGKMIFGPTPGGNIDGVPLVTPYFNWGWNYVVAASSKHPEIAYLFALFASSSEMSTLAVRQQDGYFDPFRPEHYDDSVIRGTYSDAFLKVHAESMKTAIPDLYLAGQGDYFRVLSGWLTRALSGEVSAQVALSRVEDNWNLISARADIEKQTERWLQLRNKYPPSVRGLLRDYT